MKIKDFDIIHNLRKQGVIVNPNKTVLVQKCPYCGKLFIKPHANTKYCSDKCRINYRKEYKAEWIRKYRKTHQRNELGSGVIGSTPNPDFDKELKIIQKEKRRLKLK